MLLTVREDSLNRSIKIEVVIILVTLAIVLPLAVSVLGNAPVNGQTTLPSGQMSFLSINLKEGQTVMGVFVFTGGNGTDGFQVYDPQGAVIVNSVTKYYKGNFQFTAAMDGSYTFDILYSDIQNTNYAYYQYSVRTPIILGLDLTQLITIVILLSLILTAINLLLHFKARHRRVTKQQTSGSVF